MSLLAQILQHEVIIALAVIGFLAATLGSLLLRKNDGKSRRRSRLGRLILHSGYAFTGCSIVIFIIAGFVGT